MTLTDIVHDAYPKLFRRISNEALSAGDAVYSSGNQGVTQTNNNSDPFEGIAVDTVNASKWVSIAVPPTEVYANASGAITAGSYVVATDAGKVEAWAGFGAANEIVCGKAIKAASGNIVLIRLMDGVNISR